MLKSDWPIHLTAFASSQQCKGGRHVESSFDRHMSPAEVVACTTGERTDTLIANAAKEIDAVSKVDAVRIWMLGGCSEGRGQVLSKMLSPPRSAKSVD